MIQTYTLAEEAPLPLEVTVNGTAAPVYGMYVSKDPINRRWPGRQREVAQRELAYFVSFEGAEKAEIEVKLPQDFRSVAIRPLAKRVTPLRDGNAVRFTLTDHGGYSFETDGCHGALHLFFNPPADYVFRETEEVIRYEHGTFDAGEIRLKSNQTLYIAEDAVVYANVVCENEENIRICGKGVLDNSRSKEKILFEASGDGQTDAGNAERKHFISLIGCKNVTIEGVVLRDSLCYNVSAVNCDGVLIDNLKIIGCWRYNSDGVDLQNCRNCTLKNSFIRTYDDCTGSADEIKNITYRNCYILRTSFDFLNIGCVDYADIHDPIGNFLRQIAVNRDPRLVVLREFAPGNLFVERTNFPIELVAV